ncbi:phosphodiesterase [Zobellella maritima]|uniref:phosphodiesterase n=1 Tax=Zobellella maritima TaxID=2059725 RepID=UPI000E306317|nr:phosphodiesterase [Zobellella maritima]
MKLIHFTDTHLCLPGESLYGQSPEERLQACIDSINEEHGDAALCVITGDLTHRGDPAAFELLQTLIGQLRIPCQLVIGNHDHRERLCRQFPELGRDEHGFVQSVTHTEAGTLIFMDSVKNGTHAGAYCAKRRDWLALQLEQAPGDVYLFMHHAPFATGIKAMDQIGLDCEDAAALKALLKAHGRVRHLFFGHYHRPIHGTWAGIGFSTLRSMNHQVVLDLTTPDRLAFNHEPPAYAVALLDRDQVVIHDHEFMDMSARFMPGDEPECDQQ